MAIAFSTLFVFVLLLPGLLAIVGLYKSDNLTRELIPSGALPLLAILAIASLIVHLTLVCVVDAASSRLGIPNVGLEYVLGLASLGSPNSIPLEDLAKNLRSNSGWIATYFVAAMGLGFLAGWVSGKLIQGPLRFLATHAWLYDVFGDDHRKKGKKKKGLIYAYVLSNVEHDGKRIIYCGDVNKCQYTSDGTLSYIVLSTPRRGLMKLGDNVTTCGSDGKNNWAVLELTGQGHVAAQRPGANLLYVRGENIVNVFFASQPWTYEKQAVKSLEQLTQELVAQAAALKQAPQGKPEATPAAK